MYNLNQHLPHHRSTRKILIADDHPIFRDALRHIVMQVFPAVEISEAATEEQVFAVVRDDDSFDLVLLDLGIPGASGLSTLHRLRRIAGLTPVVVVSANTDPDTMKQTFKLGARGYLTKSAERSIMVSALQLVMSGGIYVPPDALALGVDAEAIARARASFRSRSGLTERQQRVLQLLAEGQSNKQIGRTLSISEVTVKTHVSAILKRLGVENRVQAINAAQHLLRDASG
jgi:DNA-binding NarL/FixJ family response regulator